MMVSNSISTVEDYFWTRVRFNLASSNYYANPKTLEMFYRASLKRIGSDFRLLKFQMNCNDYGGRTITFTDGLFSDGRDLHIFYVLPWFAYKVHISQSSQATAKNISSIVENALILMMMNGFNVQGFLRESSYCDNINGYEPQSLIYLTRHLLSTCCFFYSKHFGYGKDKVKIERFLYLCCCNFFYRLSSQETISASINYLIRAVLTRNRTNFRALYGKGKDGPVKMTVGSIDKGTRHSISMTKYGDDVDKRIESLYKEKSVRDITKILNEDGISISKSSVERRIKKIQDRLFSLSFLL